MGGSYRFHNALFTMLVQIPDRFPDAHQCPVRGVYKKRGFLLQVTTAKLRQIPHPEILTGTYRRTK
ncbi:NAD-specific glutamate dehydrogenase domain protein [Brucella lupini]|uniref:NAD-specific glutamate dehydrogenase domain protein n=1 Tax=Brucella lupini TaxID=255457 RepID=A0A256GRA8_9HYPH|nr:NAD-specific glutamate dehydrogenase domain protein [Brucella lupini]